MKTLRIVILEEDGRPAAPGAAHPPAPAHFNGLDPRALEGLSGSDAAELLRQHAMAMSFVDTDAGGLDELEPSTSLEDRLHEALRNEDASGAPMPVMLVPPRDETAGSANPPPGRERLNDSLMRALRRHELEATLAEAEMRLRQIGLSDARHGLPRRELFLDRLDQATISVQRGGIAFTLLMIGAELPAELANDPVDPAAAPVAPGAASSLLIDAISARLQRQGRRTDSYARIGGHSFAALLIGNNSVAASMGLANRLAEDLARPVMVAGRSVRPQVTIGVALCPQHGNDPRNLLLHAHAALEQAQSGRHTVAVYDPRYSRSLHASDAAAAQTLPLKGEALAPVLAEALERHEIGVAFQPQVDLTSGQVTDIEVLARWHRAGEGQVPVREFVDVAEHHRLIARLTDQVLDQALAAARVWRLGGLQAGLSLNLSVQLLADREWPARLEAALARHAWPAASLTLEVAAPALLPHSDAHPEVLARLAEMGVRLAVDDFGNGATSYLSVAELGALAQIKIDLAALRQDARAARPEQLRAIIASAVALGHGLGARVVVKGVEHTSDLAALHDLGVDGLQGHVCAAPMAPRQLRGWWTEARRHPLAWQVASPETGAMDLDIALDVTPRS
ncbi:MAG TPA: GGDEF domain-containing phosphodiesterase [Burkholderiaceae bacterium]|nr:GGDEF domain-containing phosphodiesterase [Burkholderiaceae bacterium]HMX09587.1 GGDEF domain-containing phosphodiesterase [Burkholderiaceae bacterium]HMZ00425.1 GGDEF domain-containing phosphodiesterase [Burkholderiaceae bacterium]HNB45532.1 GGDEF domain-containing phosphodiesterase [Burkholderiaceae bacterium]HNG78740.1 GGDEF domain-containing phosphodiesterase [Burkholderiaceae bacterium]